ncbi:hypothetical protein GCM10025865_30830 [Paraoerskovia sediminicola]|uniref:Putative 3-methyladenine DNA glycosylase n=1 Tax=Paraoerskovia sediminicola TaxID=1138587 RepID=A0ABN6XG04_9CELL|nr:hypothetical protein GCM10025865_30830 [Paraoerskovia sediminicola]
MSDTATSVVPSRRWYARDVVDVARDLLGAYLTHRDDSGDVTLRITEVEAYGGSDDPGSHAASGRTDRNRAMFGEPGHLYVYRHLGLHHCVNVVTAERGSPAAVLLRAGEVVAGQEVATERRLRAGALDSQRQLARGPGRLTVALGIDRFDDGKDVSDPEGSSSSAATPRRSGDPRRTAPGSGSAAPEATGTASRGGSGSRTTARSRRTGRPTDDAERVGDQPRQGTAQWVRRPRPTARRRVPDVGRRTKEPW